MPRNHSSILSPLALSLVFSLVSQSIARAMPSKLEPLATGGNLISETIAGTTSGINSGSGSWLSPDKVAAQKVSTTRQPRRSREGQEELFNQEFDRSPIQESTQESIQELPLELLPKAAQSPTSGEKQNSFCANQLASSINQIIRETGLERSQLGILVTGLHSSQEFYNLNGDRLMIPASTVKLLTSAAILHQLGAEHRIRTSIYDPGDNSLVAIGRGDPSLDNAQFQRLGQQLRNQGKGNINLLIGDDSYFQGNLFNPAWAWVDIENGDAPPVSSLVVNQSYVYLNLAPQQAGSPLRLRWSDPLAGNQWRVSNNTRTGGSGSSIQINFNPNENILRLSGNLAANQGAEEYGLSIMEPSLYFVQRLQAELNSLGIVVNQVKVQSNRSPLVIPDLWQEVAFVESPPLRELLKEMNSSSNNFYAEMLAAQLGRVTTGDDRNWLAAVENTLTELGVDPRGYRLVDASGLARQNQVSPRAIVQTLQAMAKTPEANAYRDSLALAGETGTLSNRLRNTPATRIFWGKTGTLRGVVSLSGYVYNPDNEPLAVSITVNNSPQALADVRFGVDRLVVQMSRLRSCPS
jgi:D-alanyl-D-alanine carboxypeptidase/D-alanyl-D-alanine-endopeptidase (penicillin-binding protein 4)